MSRHDGRSSVLILGCQHGDAFDATEVLICANTLREEETIRVWLAQHGIRVGPQPDNATSAERSVAAGGYLTGDRLRDGVRSDAL